MKGLWRKLKDRHGQGLTEYALILGLVAIVVITALTKLGGKVQTTMQNVGNDLP
jgi:Flp pilus assembly pilin Flp